MRVMRSAVVIAGVVFCGSSLSGSGLADVWASAAELAKSSPAGRRVRIICASMVGERSETTGTTELRNLSPGHSLCVLEWLQTTDLVGLIVGELALPERVDPGGSPNRLRNPGGLAEWLMQRS